MWVASCGDGRFRRLQMFLGGWLWIVVDGFGCLQMVLGGVGGLQRFAVLVATVKSVALNINVVDNYGEFL